MGSIGGDTTEQGLVLHLDAANEYSYIGIGDWRDLTGYVNHGTSSAGFTPSFRSDGLGSLEYGGTNEFYQFGNDVSLQLSDYVTLEAWIKNNHQTDTNDYPAIITKRYSFNANETAYTLYLRNTIPDRQAQFIINTDSGAYGITGSSYVNDDIWHHIVCVYNGEDIRIYTDGVLEGSPKAASGSILNQNYPVYVGAMLANGNVYQAYDFTGKISIAKVYNRPLSANEVLQNYNAHKTRFGRK